VPPQLYDGGRGEDGRYRLGAEASVGRRNSYDLSINLKIDDADKEEFRWQRAEAAKNAGQKSDAMNILAGARETVGNEVMRRSSYVGEALKLLAGFEEKLDLFGEKAEGPMQ
jgi:hypothetical protein